MTVRAKIKLTSGEVLVGTIQNFASDFHLVYPPKQETEVTLNNNTRLSNAATRFISGLFTLDSSQDVINGDGVLVSTGVNFRETVNTWVSIVHDDGVAITTVPANQIAYITLYEE